MSFWLTVFGRGFESHRLHHLTIQGSPVKCKSPLKTGAFLISMVVLFNMLVALGLDYKVVTRKAA